MNKLIVLIGNVEEKKSVIDEALKKNNYEALDFGQLLDHMYKTQKPESLSMEQMTKAYILLGELTAESLKSSNVIVYGRFYGDDSFDLFSSRIPDRVRDSTLFFELDSIKDLKQSEQDLPARKLFSRQDGYSMANLMLSYVQLDEHLKNVKSLDE